MTCEQLNRILSVIYSDIMGTMPEGSVFRLTVSSYAYRSTREGEAPLEAYPDAFQSKLDSFFYS